MKQLISTILCLLLLVGTVSAQTITPNPKFGINVSTPTIGTDHPGGISDDAEMETVIALHVGWIRCNCPPAKLATDYHLQRLLKYKQNGIGSILTLSYKSGVFSVTPAMAILVAQTLGTDKLKFELTNEIDNSSFGYPSLTIFGPQLDSYIKQLKLALEAAGISVTIIGPSYCGQIDTVHAYAIIPIALPTTLVDCDAQADEGNIHSYEYTPAFSAFNVTRQTRDVNRHRNLAAQISL